MAGSNLIASVSWVVIIGAFVIGYHILRKYLDKRGIWKIKEK